ncbi:MAG: molybdopterin-containing oxidoreductase family protein [Coriobacteriales bacterium]
MEIRKGNCHYCGYLCGFNATVEDGRLVDLEPDPTRFPYDTSTAMRCRRWRMNLDAIDGADRVNYPLRRVGERGSGEWERVTWDEALDDIAVRMQALVAEHGPGTVASAIGGPHATFWPLHRFLNTLGSPNNMGIGQICWNPRIWVQSLTYGWPIENDINPDTSKAVFLWATNPAVSDNSLFWRMLRDMVDKGIPLVVVDPRACETARAATLHLAPFPGTDCTLILGMIREIIVQGWEDKAFVDEWCHGYEGLVEHVEPYTPEYVELVTGVPAADMCRAAEIFATSGATALLSGRGIDQLGANTLPTLRSLAILRAITGGIDRPGTCVLNTMSDYIPEIDMEMSYYGMPDDIRAAQLNTPHSPLQCYDGWDGAIELTWQQGRRLPMRYLTSAHPNLVWRAAITGEPYPVRALIVEAANPLITYANTHLVYEAFQHLDLIVVLEYYLTPTAQMADYVLPAAAAFERPVFQAQGGVANVAYGGARTVDPYYERRCDYDFFHELGLRMGQEDVWPQETLDEALAVQMSASRMTWEEFAERGLYAGYTRYLKHERVDKQTGEKRGFSTTTGKVELRCEYLVARGATAYPEPVPLDDAVDVAYAESLGLQVEDGAVLGTAGSAPATRAEALSGEGSAKRDFAPALQLRRERLRRSSVFAERSASTKSLLRNSPDSASAQVADIAGPARVLRMITGARKQPYWASSYFNNPAFRASHPYPTAAMSPATLAAAGIEPGEWVEVSTSKGTARFMAAEEQMVDGVVSVEYGWWYPEEEQCEPKIGGMWESNVNVLTSGDIETSEPLIGSWKYNGILCRVEPCTQDGDRASASH